MHEEDRKIGQWRLKLFIIQIKMMEDEFFERKKSRLEFFRTEEGKCRKEGSMGIL